MVSESHTEGIPFNIHKKTSWAAWLKRWTSGTRLDSVATQNTTFVNFSNSVILSPVPYIPQTLACFLGRMAELSTIQLLYLVRFFNLIVGVLLMAAALYLIRDTLHWPWLFLWQGTPIYCFLLGSAGADVTTLGLAFLVFALFLAEYSRPERIATRYFFIVAILLGLCKSVYLLVPLVFFGLHRFRKPLLALGLLGAAWVPGVLWTVHQQRLFPQVRIDIHLNPVEQLHFVITHPFRFFAVTLKHWLVNGMGLTEQVIGKLGWLDVDLGYKLLGSYLTLLVLALVYSQGTERLTTRPKLWISAIVFSTFELIALAMYLWTPFGVWRIEGMQGRYLLPILPCLSLIPSVRSYRWLKPGGLVTCWALLSVWALGITFHRYWVP